MNEKDFEWEVRSSRVVFENPWVELIEDDVRTPQGKELTWWTVKRPDAAVVLPLTEDNEVILIGGYRHPVRQFLWELPAGLKEESDVDLLTTAKRELEEETGVTALRWDTLAAYPIASGSHRQMLELYLARELTFGEARPDDAEHLTVKRMPLEEALVFSRGDNVVSGSTIVGLYRAKELLEKEGVL